MTKHHIKKTHFFKLFIATTALILSTLVFSFSMTNPVSATDDEEDSGGGSSICSNDNVSSEVKAAAGCSEDDDTFPIVIANIIKGIILVLGFVAVIYIVIGGVGYMTSSGDSNKVKKAKDTILYAVIGLIICALSFAIVQFVLDGILTDNSKEEDEEEAYHTTLVQNDIAFFKK